ncbi:hypothetical protein VDF98_03230 [Xanthomonas campestris pv. raphani]|uniref:hypothetical protein n=1 Tax=Xanthomonas campestris TaxID=339 RepID=UPI0023680875|nr:hypothetical protein [Xanthomonas campestris]MEA9822451.1 hypothetical protein [Xanthomonas campestris pv. raphani]MEA9850816.1 hypothetical protein [Xanthomonas campestris pv. raphani]MEA9854989.1 hypothetical protein [Xanthomonas campestris pv. raphani]MEA9963894.1 hypothetical protein [Xanthomonas campestris pv. raphani]WDJ24277.1 hypothetical protein JH270_10470 [Xanthomonas campestris pv. raphani]
MTDSILVEHKLDTIHRQAKRFAARLKLPITVAKDILARSCYRCSAWTDLVNRLKRRTLDKNIQLLASLPSSSEARSYFFEVRRDLARSMSQHLLTNTNLAGMLGHLQEIFAVGAGPILLGDVVPTLNASEWQPANIGPDPWAVVESEVVVNGTCLRLIGTRTYLPRFYDFGSERGEYAEPVGKLRIVWKEPAAWYQAALDYLNDPNATDVLLPIIELTEEMARHQDWFETALATSSYMEEYGLGDDDLVPVFVEGQNCYVVFGYPVNPSPKQANLTTIELASADHNFSQVVELHGSPVCLEWISYDPKTRMHPGEFGEYFEKLKLSILVGDELYSTLRKDGQSGILFVRPATDFDIRHELKMEFTHLGDEIAFVLKTTNLALCRDLLGKVASRELMVYSSGGKRRYFSLLLVSKHDGPPELSLAFESESPGMTGMSNLVHSWFVSEEKDGWEMLLEIAPELINLTDRIGVRALGVAISYGLIQRLPVDFMGNFSKPPARCDKIPQVPEDVIEQLERPLNSDGVVTLRSADYSRDNF